MAFSHKHNLLFYYWFYKKGFDFKEIESFLRKTKLADIGY